MPEVIDGASDDAIAEEIAAAVSDYLDGALPPERRAEVEAALAREPAWQRARAAIAETREALSGLQRARPPGTFDQGVTATIHRRSAGRFFARRTLGDRVPFGALLVVALLVVIPIVYVLWTSTTGSLRRDPAPAAPAPPAGRLLPTP
jgi:anti-sigma factor RsiW